MSKEADAAVLYYVHDPMCSWCWGFVPVQQQLQAEIELTRQLQVSSFPSLVLKVGNAEWRVPVDYNDSTPMLELVTELTA